MGSDTNQPAISVVIPAYNEGPAVGHVVSQVKECLQAEEVSFEIVVIDDGSEDETAAVATEAGARVVRHPYNIGNGAAVKTGIRQARGDILVMLDGDGQHRPEAIPRLLEELGPYDMVVGARTRGSRTALHRDLANTVYNWLAGYVCGRKIDDLTSGFRAIKTAIARRFAYLLPNTFSYPTTLTLAVVRSGHSLAYVPVQTARRVGRSKIRLLRDGARFLLIILRIATFFSPMKVFLPASVLMFLLGFGYGLYKVVVLGSRYGPTSAMLMTVSVLVFLVGLVSEQVAQLGFSWSDTTAQPREGDAPSPPPE